MIKSNELRIGNYVSLTLTANKQEYPLAHQIETSDFETIDIINYHPIPLTPEILEKCGFVFDSDLYTEQEKSQYILFKSMGRERLVYYSEEDIYKYMICDYGIDKQVAKTVHSLHQLQNLYFALTGDELEVKELDLIPA